MSRPYDPYKARHPHPALPEISALVLALASIVTMAALVGGVIFVGLLIRTLGRAIWAG